MARQTINVGTAANDGTGDTLRGAGEKINDNFSELYFKLGGDSDVLSQQISLSVGSIIFEGATADDNETFLQVVDPTADRTITLPDATGQVVLRDTTDTLTNKTITSPVLSGVQINDTSADHKYTVGVSELTANRTITLPLLTSNDTFVFQAHTQTLTNKTLTTPTISSPRITTAILDTNGAEVIKLTPQASSVNQLQVTNAPAGGIVSLSATGTDTNVELSVASKGSDNVVVSKLAYGSEIITANGTSSASVSFHICDKGTALAVTLPDGTKQGEVQNFVCKGMGDTTIAPTNFLTGTSVTIQQGEAASFFWDGSNWFLLASYNGTLNA